MAAALERHNEAASNALEAHGGDCSQLDGDAFCVAFRAGSDAAEGALRAQRALLAEDFSAVDGIFVRMALHTGYVEERDGDYLGPTLKSRRRLVSIGYGGQYPILGQRSPNCSRMRRRADATLRDLGAHRLKDLSRPEHVYQLVAAAARRRSKRCGRWNISE